MGIYIPNMEMPKSCKECYDKGICYHIHHIAYCPLCGEIENPASYVLASIKRPDCPLVPVPPHGRLIDADEAIGHLFNGEQCLYSWDEIEEAVDATPTIIPAEEGET